jgi:hypothetical protein
MSSPGDSLAMLQVLTRNLNSEEAGMCKALRVIPGTASQDIYDRRGFPRIGPIRYF